MKLAISSALALLGLAGFASGLPNITRQGKYLYDPDGNRFFIKVSNGRARKAGATAVEGWSCVVV